MDVLLSVTRELAKWGGNNSAKLWDSDLLLQTVGAMAGPRAQERIPERPRSLSGADAKC